MEDTIIGTKRRYHIESLVADTPLGTVYSAFSRRKAGNKFKRRYYAVVESSFNNDSVQPDLIARLPSGRFHLEESLILNGNIYSIIASGPPKKESESKFVALCSRLSNKGYLMVILAALILILMIVKFFQ